MSQPPRPLVDLRIEDQDIPQHARNIADAAVRGDQVLGDAQEARHTVLANVPRIVARKVAAMVPEGFEVTEVTMGFTVSGSPMGFGVDGEVQVTFAPRRQE